MLHGHVWSRASVNALIYQFVDDDAVPRILVYLTCLISF